MLVDGNIPGDSDGVAELEGTLADGTSACTGELAGPAEGDEVGGDTAGPLADGTSAEGTSACTGELAGPAGGDEVGGDTAGVLTGASADGEGVAGDGIGTGSLVDGVDAGEAAVGG